MQRNAICSQSELTQTLCFETPNLLHQGQNIRAHSRLASSQADFGNALGYEELGEVDNLGCGEEVARGREWYTFCTKGISGVYSKYVMRYGTFRHAVQAAQIASLSDTDA